MWFSIIENKCDKCESKVKRAKQVDNMVNCYHKVKLKILAKFRRYIKDAFTLAQMAVWKAHGGNRLRHCGVANHRGYKIGSHCSDFCIELTNRSRLFCPVFFVKCFPASFFRNLATGFLANITVHACSSALPCHQISTQTGHGDEKYASLMN